MEEREAALKCHQMELELMTRGLSSVEAGRQETAVLVLCCRSEETARAQSIKKIDPAFLARGLGLRRSDSRPWAAFDVDIDSMDGLARAFDWILYHCQKKRNSLRYHSGQERR